MSTGPDASHRGTGRLTVGELLGGTLRVMQRAWPFIVAVTIAVLVAIGIWLLIVGAVFSGIASAMRPTSYSDFESMVATTMVLALVSLVLTQIVAAILSAPWLGVTVAATDEVLSGRPLTTPGLISRVRPRIGPLIGYMMILVAIAVVLPSFLLTLVSFFTTSIAALAMVFLVTSAATVAVMILLDLAPCIILIEGAGTISAIRRSAAMAKPGFVRLLGLHAVWIAIVMPPLLIFLTADNGFGVFVMLIAMAVIAPAFIVYMTLVYRDLRAAEQGTRLDLELREPAVTAAEALGRLGISTGAPVRSAGPSSGQTQVPAPPSPTARFNPPPGWPPVEANWKPIYGWQPDPAWPAPPAGWKFWSE